MPFATLCSTIMGHHSLTLPQSLIPHPSSPSLHFTRDAMYNGSTYTIGAHAHTCMCTHTHARTHTHTLPLLSEAVLLRLSECLWNSHKLCLQSGPSASYLHYQGLLQLLSGVHMLSASAEYKEGWREGYLNRWCYTTSFYTGQSAREGGMKGGKNTLTWDISY